MTNNQLATINEKQIAILNEYPKEKYNVLIPVKTMQEISPLHKVIINQVTLSTNPNDNEVYQDSRDSTKNIPTKVGLTKLMTAANIQFVDSKQVLPSTCTKCMEKSKMLGKVSPCGNCNSKGDVAFTVTIAVPEPSGNFRMVKSTKELICEEVKKTMKKESQYSEWYKHRTAQCETKALLRALRTALMIKNGFTNQELLKPFVVAYVVPDMNNPEIKAAVAQRYASGAMTLFGAAQQAEALPVSTGNTILPDERDIQDEHIEPIIEMETLDEVIEENPMEGVVFCQGCGEIIEDTQKWKAEQIATFSKQKCGYELCLKCQASYKRGELKL